TDFGINVAVVMIVKWGGDEEVAARRQVAGHEPGAALQIGTKGAFFRLRTSDPGYCGNQRNNNDAQACDASLCRMRHERTPLARAPALTSAPHASLKFKLRPQPYNWTKVS